MIAAEPSCAGCANAVLPAKEKSPELRNWLQDRGLAFCAVYRKRTRRRFLITLANAAGPFCGGRDFAGKTVDLIESAGAAGAE